MSSLHAQPRVSSSEPPTGAANVAPSAAVVLSFSEPMDPEATSVMFMDTSNPFNLIRTTDTWSANNTVLTCTPIPPAFPSGKLIYWSVNGLSAEGEETDGTDIGYFTTGSGGTSTGWGTNKVTSFNVGVTHFYNQTNASVPILDQDLGYAFSAGTILASNRTANLIAVTMPGGSVSNLTQNFMALEQFFLFDTSPDLGSFNAAYPGGPYQFFVQAPTSNQTVSVTLQAAGQQPGVPHISNFAAAQAINPSQSFQLTWDAFTGGTAADHISVYISDVDYQSPDYGKVGALTGTATSWTIPANTLQANSNYSATLTFHRFSLSSNVTYTTSAFRSTVTDFSLTTIGSGAPAPVVSKPGWVAGRFTFDVASAAGQPVTVEYSSNLLAGQWYPLITTNSPGGVVRITDPGSATNRTLFYRTRTGS